jgi:hypothetical protein
MGSASSNLAVYTLRVGREQLDQLREIAWTEHRTLAQKLRLMIEREIADAKEKAA